MIIAFTGPKGCGKSSAARMLKDFEIISFAAPMKKCLKDLFNFSDHQLTTLEGKEAIDPRYGVSPRVIMQQFGTEFVRKTVPGLWEKLMIDRINGDILKDYAIDDCRFPTEAQLVRDMGGVVVHLTGRRDGKVYMRRWYEDFLGHRSERGVKVLSTDIVIDNSGSLSDLRHKLIWNGLHPSNP